MEAASIGLFDFLVFDHLRDSRQYLLKMLDRKCRLEALQLAARTRSTSIRRSTTDVLDKSFFAARVFTAAWSSH